MDPGMRGKWGPNSHQEILMDDKPYFDATPPTEEQRAAYFDKTADRVAKAFEEINAALRDAYSIPEMCVAYRPVDERLPVQFRYQVMRVVAKDAHSSYKTDDHANWRVKR
jgi:hypothetical protein